VKKRWMLGRALTKRSREGRKKSVHLCKGAREKGKPGCMWKPKNVGPKVQRRLKRGLVQVEQELRASHGQGPDQEGSRKVCGTEGRRKWDDWKLCRRRPKGSLQNQREEEQQEDYLDKVKGNRGKGVHFTSPEERTLVLKDTPVRENAANGEVCSGENCNLWARKDKKSGKIKNSR